MNEDELSNIVIGCAIEIHKHLGPGLLESTYKSCLAYEIEKRLLKVEREKSLPLTYKELILETAYRIDLLVEDKLIVEVKCVEAINEVHIAQVLTYLKFSNKKLGLLINFNCKLLKEGIKRVIN